MQKLKVGDKVLTTTETDKAEYQPVYAFGHRSPTTLGRFLQITTDTDSLEITGEHLLYVADKSYPVRADSIIVGDKLQTADGTANQVKKIKTVMKEGLYAPLTPGGKLVINGIQPTLLLRRMTKSCSPLSMVSSLSPTHLTFICISPLFHGMPLYIKWGIDVINMAHRYSNVYAELIFFVISGIFLSGFVAVEALFGATLGPLIVFSVCVAYSFVRKTHTAKTNKVKTA
ncbi:Desert hedgehog protein [Seminavis robusta]|uniref:Desert hedgehog protein n=1 Tax=Seminavis robusta TaxID=568900 RepID=A0A9N8HK05_9STRA|nr:Desert hedgehog protein [Seminavis robusta]